MPGPQADRQKAVVTSHSNWRALREFLIETAFVPSKIGASYGECGLNPPGDECGSVTGFAHLYNLLGHGFTGRAVVSSLPANDRRKESNGVHTSASV